jgi:hypothetical protein
MKVSSFKSSVSREEWMNIGHPTLKWEEFEEEAQHWLFRTWSGTLQGRTGTGCPSHMKR